MFLAVEAHAVIGQSRWRPRQHGSDNGANTHSRVKRMANLLAGRQRDTPSSGGQTESLSCILPPSPQELPPSSAASGMLRTPESVHVQPSSHDVPNGCSPPESSTGSKQPDHEQEDEDTGYSGILDDADNDKGKTLFYTGGCPKLQSCPDR